MGRSAVAWPLALVVMTIASPARAAIGGPDAAGYVYADQADGAPYSYVDITATGVLIASGDEQIATIDLAAPFTFYGQVVAQLSASTNGFLSDENVDADPGNSCPVPSAVDGGGFRIAVLHDDLVGDVYYEYFDEIDAAAIGFANAQGGVSVFQWVGAHAIGGAGYDGEAVLFHGSGAILLQYADDGDAGAGSTIGLQDSGAAIGLEYACDDAGAITGGASAVRFVPYPFGIQINEIRVDQSSVGDEDEAVELVGPPGASLDGLRYLVVGDSPGGLSGVIEAVVDLDGQSIGADGYFVVAEATYTVGVADLTTSLNFENADTVTHMLVSGFSGANGNDLDPDDDGVLDTVPWTGTLDVVALVNIVSAELPYGPGASCSAGADCVQYGAGIGPSQVFRCPDGFGGYNNGNFNIALLPATDTPHAANPCVCGDGVVLLVEDCDDAGESAACDIDCTLVSCGDGVLNASAGETCDDGNAMDGDGCSAACLVEEPIGSSSGESSSSGGSSSGGSSSGETSGAGSSSDGSSSDASGSTGTSTGTSSSSDASSSSSTDTSSSSDATSSSDASSAGTSSSSSSSSSDATSDSSAGESGSGGSNSQGTAPDTGGSEGSLSEGSASGTLSTSADDSGSTQADSSGEGGLSGGASSDDGCACTTDARPRVPWWCVVLFAITRRARRARGR